MQGLSHGGPYLYSQFPEATDYSSHCPSRPVDIRLLWISPPVSALLPPVDACVLPGNSVSLVLTSLQCQGRRELSWRPLVWPQLDSRSKMKDMQLPGEFKHINNLPALWLPRCAASLSGFFGVLGRREAGGAEQIPRS